MSQINYANATFNKVVLEGTDFKDKEAVTASYVTSKIDDLVNGASTSFDTLKELSLALSNGEDVAVAVTSQISSLGLSLNSESNARVAYESANDVSMSVVQGNVASLLTSVDTIVTMRLPSLDNSVATLQSDLTSERNDRIEAGNYFTSSINTIDSKISVIEPSLADVIASDAGKLPLAGGSMTGDLSMLSHHLYIGEKWRLEASGSELHFRYSADGINWGTAISFNSP